MVVGELESMLLWNKIYRKKKDTVKIGESLDNEFELCNSVKNKLRN